MAIAQKTVTIKDTDYLLTQIPAMRGLKLLKQITKLAGPAIVASQGDNANIGSIIEAVMEHADEANIEELIVTLVQSASKGSMAINFDMEFAGDYGKLLLLVKEIVEFNFGSVFTDLGSNG